MAIAMASGSPRKLNCTMIMDTHKSMGVHDFIVAKLCQNDSYTLL